MHISCYDRFIIGRTPQPQSCVLLHNMSKRNIIIVKCVLQQYTSMIGFDESQINNCMFVRLQTIELWMLLRALIQYSIN